MLACLILNGVPTSAQPPGLGAAAIEAARQMAAAVPGVEGTVTSVEGNRVFVDVGARDGVHQGLDLVVSRAGKPLGVVVVREARERFSIAELVEPAEGVTLAREDRVKFGGERIVIALADLDTGGVGGMVNPTRDLTLALIRARFEVIEEPHLKVGLWTQQPLPLTDPRALAILAERQQAHLLVLSRLARKPEGTSLEMEALSTRTGATVARVSVPFSPQVPGPPPPAARPAEATEKAPGPSPQIARAAPGPEIAQPTTPAGLPVAPGFIQGPDFPAAMRALALGDVDGDGRLDVVVADDHHLYAYAFDGARFHPLWKRAGRKGERIIALDAADINGNGIDELFVTSFDGNRPTSYVLEPQRGAMAILWEDADLFFRVLPTGERGRPELLGQRPGLRHPFDSLIHRYRWETGRYREGPPLGIPQGLSLYGLAVGDLEGRGELRVLALDAERDRLRIFDTRGRLLYMSDDRLGGSDQFVHFRLSRGAGTNGEESGLTLPILSRISLMETTGQGKQIVVWQNIPATTYVLRPTSRLYNRVRLFGFRWNGSVLERLWETQELRGYLADYSVGRLGRGAEQYLFVLLVQRVPGLGGGLRSQLVASRWLP